MQFKLRERPAAAPKTEQEVGDDSTKNDALDAAASARRALDNLAAADAKRAEAARRARRIQREETQRRGTRGGCVC